MHRGYFTCIKLIRQFTSRELPSWTNLTGKGLGVIKLELWNSRSMDVSSTYWPKQEPFQPIGFSMDSGKRSLLFYSYSHSPERVSFNIFCLFACSQLPRLILGLLNRFSEVGKVAHACGPSAGKQGQGDGNFMGSIGCILSSFSQTNPHMKT